MPQLQKHNWKAVRYEVPCTLCGNPKHPAAKCRRYTKAGKPRKQPRRKK